MKVQIVNCTVGIKVDPSHEHFAHQVPRYGIDALPVTEIAILQARHGDHCISDVSIQGEYETTKKDEYARLLTKYRPDDVALVYHAASAPFPSTIEDLEISREQMAKTPFEIPDVIPSDLAIAAAQAEA